MKAVAILKNKGLLKSSNLNVRSGDVKSPDFSPLKEVQYLPVFSSLAVSICNIFYFS